jgi:hypothetical protein
LFTGLSLFEYFLFAATQREIKNREEDGDGNGYRDGEKMKRGGDGDS